MNCNKTTKQRKYIQQRTSEVHAYNIINMESLETLMSCIEDIRIKRKMEVECQTASRSLS